MLIADTKKLYASNDAQVWAEEFMKVVEAGVQIDEGLMVTWFANAIVTAEDLLKKDIGKV